ncbi:hypothetical protein [Mycolicibacter virginiensis]|uniref:hypothetical protein n=1 Tax=Mycolicibacter virginiensis TaxID=1795032 RepID=UPI001F04873E|nr:hypothetical protein [Mycolicibacter virginiensis]ULP48030.1 hypothetical protein MJO54_02340 [Mycolicibacter virginiensis]
MWNKALLAAVPAALFLAAPAPVVHADGACTAFANANDVDAYQECTRKMNVRCKSQGVFLEHSVTCTYPDGGRDECIEHVVYGGAGRLADAACAYVPPDSDPAPAPVGEPS